MPGCFLVPIPPLFAFFYSRCTRAVLCWVPPFWILCAGSWTAQEGCCCTMLGCSDLRETRINSTAISSDALFYRTSIHLPTLNKKKQDYQLQFARVGLLVPLCWCCTTFLAQVLIQKRWSSHCALVECLRCLVRGNWAWPMSLVKLWITMTRLWQVWHDAVWAEATPGTRKYEISWTLPEVQVGAVQIRRQMETACHLFTPPPVANPHGPASHSDSFPCLWSLFSKREYVQTRCSWDDHVDHYYIDP
jgi:hypothetical protein